MRLFLIALNSNIKLALNKIRKNGKKFLIVHSNNKFCGTLTDGDLRYALLQNKTLKSPIEGIFNTNPVIFSLSNIPNNLEIKKLMKKKGIEFIPVIDENNFIKKIITYESLEKKIKKKKEVNKLKNKIVIMSGGMGKRLYPFTKILPKPLIPVNDKPIIQHIIDNFKKFGANEFIFSLNYKANLIKSYLLDSMKSENFKFVLEKKPLGTAGSLKLMQNMVRENFVLTNCDILINANFNDIIKYHKKLKNIITVIIVKKSFKASYGNCSIDEKKKILLDIVEKPQIKLLVNTGAYIMSKKALGLIKKNEKIDMNVLLERAIKQKIRVGYYKVKSNSWHDIGEWVAYKKSANKMKNIL